MPPSKKKAGSSAKRKMEGTAPTAATKKAKPNPSFPGKISKTLTIAQLQEEAEARGLDLGNVKHDKAFLLGLLGEGSSSVVALRKKPKAKSPAQSKKTSATSSKKLEPVKVGTKTAKASKQAASTNITKASPKKPKAKPTAKSTTKDPKIPTAANSLKATKKVTPAAKSEKATKSSTAKPNRIPKSSPKPDKAISSVSSVAVASSKPTPNPSTNVSSTSFKTTSSKKKAASATKPATTTVYPRITNKLTLAELKEEAAARHLDPKGLPKLKADLLHHLVEGSIHVKETKTYKAYQNLLQKVEGEKAKLYQESLKKKQETDARKEARRCEKFAKEEKLRQEEEKERLQLRNQEKVHQKCHHVHSFPQVHPHPLAKTSSLLLNGERRPGACDYCRTPNRSIMSRIRAPTRPTPAVYTCEECDYDICQECFDAKNISDAEKERIQLEKLEEQKQREAEQRRREEEDRIRWDAPTRFKTSIMKPPAKSKNASSKLKYTVYCSDGYDYDGWHSYQGEPTKEFDTMWATKKEANDRAEYLFFWKNPWGLAPNEVSDDYEGNDISPEEFDDMHKWTVAPPDSSRWTVGVVPAELFLHLENASQHRHNYDDEREPHGHTRGSSCSASIMSVW